MDVAASRERPIAIAEEHVHVETAGGDEVEVAISVQVADGGTENRRARRRLKCAVAVPEQHALCAPDDVRNVIVIEVRGQRGCGRVACDRGEAGCPAVLEEFEVRPIVAITLSVMSPGQATLNVTVTRKDGAEMLQPTLERHGLFSHFKLVCGRMAGHLPGAQTERRGGAGPVGGLLGGKDL